MKLSHAIAPALAAVLVAACASQSTHASAPERAEQAEENKQQAQEDARKARLDAEKARVDAQDATRAQREADEKAQFAAQTAAHAERDVQSQPAPGAGVAEPQAVDRRAAVAASNSGVSFAVGGDDLRSDDKVRLDEMAATLRAHPAQKVVVEGYSDDNSSDSTNAQLSRRRADAVAHYLESKGVSSDRIVTKVGLRNAAGTDDTNRRRPVNRGAEIIIK